MSPKHPRFVPVLVLLTFAPACNRRATTAPPAGEKAAAPAAASPAEKGPHGSVAMSTPGDVTGTVEETIDSGGYTYLRLRTPGGETWAAVRQAAVEKGSKVTVFSATAMDGFESKTLNRKFDRIVFGTLEPGTSAPGGRDASTAAAPAHDVAGSPHSSAAKDADAGAPIKVAKAEGQDGRTVAELFARKGALKDKPVEVRGKVVKFLPEIMGKNWIHLRDGSGTRAAKDDDVTVTTKDSVTVGSVVLVRGTLRVDRDMGAGYNYPVIIEEAKVSK